MSIHDLPVSSLRSRRPRLDRSARILIIDQGSDIGIGLMLMLRIWGHAVSIARTWKHGLIQARESEPHVVLINLDLLLPGTLHAAMRALQSNESGAICLVALKGGMPYFIEPDAAGRPQLRLATTPALKATIRSLVEPEDAAGDAARARIATAV